MQNRKSAEDVIHFAWEEKLFLLADEVMGYSVLPNAQLRVIFSVCGIGGF